MSGFLWSSSFLVLAVCLIRQLLKKHISMKHRYSLWLLVAIWLCLLPVYQWLPQSSLSIVNVAELAKGAILQKYPQAAPLVNQLETGQVYVDTDTEFLLVRAAGVDWQLILYCIWAVGAVVIAVWIWRTQWRFHKQMLEQRVELGRKSSIRFTESWLTLPVYLVKELASPCLLQVHGEAAIYIPDRLLENPEALRHAVAHEMCHYRQKDLYWNWLRCYFLMVYWFHPLVWLAAALSRQDCELSCDEAAIALLGEEERFSYGRTLLSLVGVRSGMGDMVRAETRMTADTKQLRSRILAIAKSPKMAVWAVLAFYLLISLSVLLAFGRSQEQTIFPNAREIVEEMGKESVSAENTAEELSAYLVENHLLYVGDMVRSGRIVSTCIRAAGQTTAFSTELQTSEEPYIYRMVYDEAEGQTLDAERIREVSILIFASIDNLGALEVYTGPDGIQKGELFTAITRQEAMELYGLESLTGYGESEEEMLELVEMVQERL